MPVNANRDTEFDGKRDKLGRYKRPHIVSAAEELMVLHVGDDDNPKRREEVFEGVLPLPTGLKKPEFAVPKWKGSFIEEK